MRSCHDVLHRLLHDSTLCLSEDVQIGYLDRFMGILELPLQNFSSAQIPFHRIEYFRHGSEVIWHKQTRLDLLFESTDREKAFTNDAVHIRKQHLQQAQNNRLELEQKLKTDFCSKLRSRRSIAAAFSDVRRVPLHYCSVLSAQWISTDSSTHKTLEHIPQDPSNSINVATYNVLDDHCLPHAVKNVTALRWKTIIQQVRQNPAHFWAFSEATPSFASALLEDEFIQNTYSSSDSCAGAFQTLSGEAGATGQLVLIRRDIAVQAVFFTSTQLATGKRLVFVLARFPSGMTVALCAIHLTSGQLHQSHSPAAVEKRRQQLQYILSKLDGLQDECEVHVIVGDFNFKGVLDETMGSRLLEGFVEADENLAGCTFDPMRNSLAALNSNQTSPMRLDRIYIRHMSKDRTIQVQNHLILGQNPIPISQDIENLLEVLPNGLYPSDHFGLISMFTVHGRRGAKQPEVSWSTASALAIVPDKDVQECVDTQWRAEYDPSHQKWPPHINILYPFVNAEAIPQACSLIRNYLNIQAFNVPSSLHMQMESVRSFQHKSSQTVYLSPVDEQLRNLHEIIKQCVVQSFNVTAGITSGKRRSEYTPHMTIAKLQGYNEEQISDFLAKAEINLSRITSKLRNSNVNSISVMRRSNGEMIVVDSIELPNFDDYSPAQRSLELVKSLITCTFGETAKPKVIPVGSCLLLGKRVFSDLDVVVLPPEESQDMEASSLFDKMQTLLPENVHMRLVSDARCPIISISVGRPEYLPIDIVFGAGGFTNEIINDSCALQERMKLYDVGGQNLVKEALFHLKYWATSKQFCGRAFNLFPGVAWPIALFSAIANNEQVRWDSWRTILIRFFDVFREADWKNYAIKMDGRIRREALRYLSERGGRGDRCIIVAPTSNCNVAEFVVSCVLKSFNEECRRALDILQSEKWEAAWNEYRDEEMQMGRLFDYGIDITITIPKGASHDEISGWLKGKFAGIIERHFECQGIAIRPSTTLQWEETYCEGVQSSQGVLSCGIDTALTSVRFSNWKIHISTAETELRDRLLRWDKRPKLSSISVVLWNAKVAVDC